MFTTAYKKQGHTPKPQGNTSRRNNRSRNNNWYTSSTSRPRGTDLDKRTYGPIDPGKERSRIRRGVEEEEDEKPEVDKKELETKLHVKGVDLHIDENVEKHHTDQYECTDDRTRESDNSEQKAELVIRRGQDFKMTINFDRPYDIEKNDITLLFKLGDDYKPNRKLNATFKVDETGKDTKYKPKKWGATVIDKKDNSLTLNVFVPASAPVGEWEFSIRTIVDVKDGKDLRWQYNHTADYIKILFNPWCKEDLTYMEDEEWRNETVLNDSGAVYNGGYKKIGARAWFFGQFQDEILDIALHLVRKGFGFQSSAAMANPSVVSRIVSTIVNSSDDNGVLVGNWSGDYSGGAKPTSWNGSVKILRQYMKTGRPVRYGQCWVFSAVSTTVCRALGLPCRSVTNHSSAHNTDLERISIDVFSKRNKAGEWVEVKNDSIWNFHVWNECWFRVPHLNTEQVKYDGWHVIDATPQEHSDGVYCCGPAPVKAIKEGHIDVGKDSSFVFAEVNADKVEWKENENTGRLMERKRQKNIVGKCISTHKPTGKPYSSSTMGSFLRFFGGGDDMEREDLTKDYKYPEGSEEERTVYRKTDKKFRQMCGFDDDDDSEHECEEEEPVDIEIEEAEEEVFVGNDFSFNVTVKNNGKEDRTMTLTLKVLYKTYYDSVTGVAVTKKFENVKLGKGKTEKYKLEVDEKRASLRPQDGFNFEVKAVAEFKENDHIVTADMDYRLRRPDLEVKGPKTCGRDETIKVEVSFKNPLKVPLTHCRVDLEGGFKLVGRTKDSFTISNIAPGDTWSTTLQLKPNKPNQRRKERELTVGFDSKELADISGMYNVEVD